MATVNFIPNDPLAAGGPPPRRIRPPRYPASRAAARFDVRPAAPAGLYEPHTPAFDFWQAQTALVLALRAWRALDGSYVSRWAGGRTVLPALTNAGDGLNAFYDRESLQFFTHTLEGRTVHACESVDVVVHESGHAFLDAIRPDLFDVPFVEAAALHEAFADCFALLVALADVRIRRRVLERSPDLGAHQFVESLAEELGDAVRREFGPQAAEPGALRRALNAFRWAEPTALPPRAPASRLSREPHSFSRVFTGCFYDTIRNLFTAGPRTPAGLGRAATTAGRLLLSALRTVPATPRLFEGVGRRMVQADIVNNRAASVPHIQAAFAAHGIALAAPAASLPVPLAGGRAAAAARELRARLSAPSGAKLRLTRVESDLHGEIAHVQAFRPIRLTAAALKGLYILVPAVARVAVRGRSVVGLLGQPCPVEEVVEADAHAFARALAANGEIERDRARRAPRGPSRPPSHVVRAVGGRPTIVRRGFA